MMYLQMYSECWENVVSSKWQLMNNIYENGEWPVDLIEVTMMSLQKKAEAAKWSNDGTVAQSDSSHMRLR